MVDKPTIKVKCKILKFEDNPKGGTNVWVECTRNKHVWVVERWLNYDRPISMEEFKRELAKTEIIPKKPTDNLWYVKEEAHESFTIEVKNSPNN